MKQVLLSVFAGILLLLGGLTNYAFGAPGITAYVTLSDYACYSSQNSGHAGELIIFHCTSPNSTVYDGVAGRLTITGNVTNAAVPLSYGSGYFTCVLNDQVLSRQATNTSTSPINFYTSTGNLSSGATFNITISCFVPDVTPPSPQSAATNTSGNQVTITFDESVEWSEADVSDFTVKVGGSPVTLNGVSFSGTDAILTLQNAVASGQTVTVSYNNTADGLFDDIYNATASFTNYAVTNNSTVVGVTAPTVTSSSATNIATTSATLGGNVTATGGANITERGVYWSTTSGFPNGAGTKVSTTGDWSATGIFTQAITGLTAGTTYYVKAFATNSAGTSYGTQVSFTTQAITLNALSQTNVSCNGGSNGAASVSAATGGTEPYTYNWTPGNPTGDGTTSVTGLTAGIWTCTVTDADNGTVSRSFTITQPSALNLTPASQTNIACNGGSNGAATVNAATGGSGGYTYNWTPGNPTGDGTTSVSGLTAGTWTCTVTDANGCTASYSFTIIQPTALNLTPASQTNIACNGGANGAATVNAATGGSGGYTYNWTPGNPTGDGTTSVSGLTAGMWTCTVTDANGCTASYSFTIIQPTALNLTPASQTNISCNGGSNGAATVNAATGGSGGYTYNWTPGNPTGDGTTSVSGLTAGTWTCTVTDANGCTASQNFTVTQPSALSLTAASQTNVSCNGGANGAATVNAATGGSGGYTYNWTPGNPTGDGTTSVSGLTAGTWTCTVTDANGCTASQNFTVTQPSALSLTAASQTNVSCNGGANGAATLAATGGSGGYTYNWTPGNPTGDGTTSVSGLTTGTWTCTVTDANGCTASQNFTVTQPTALLLTAASQTNVSVNGGSNGVAAVNTATGGTAPYTYDWTPGNPAGDGTTSVSGLDAGTWTCTVTDANGCSTQVSISILEPATITTAIPYNLTFNSATLGGDVTSDGGASVSERGVVYSATDATPTIAEGATKDMNGTGTGAFSESIGSLSPATTYYIQAYATNSEGTSYGGVVIFTTQKLSQTITFNDLPAKTYGDADFAPDASASSTLIVTYSSSDADVATIVSNQIHIVGAGSCTIYADQPGNGLYSAAPQASKTLTVAKATLTATADNQTKVYGATNPTLTFQYSGWVNGVETIDTPPTIATTITGTSAADIYSDAITLSGGSDNNYTFSLVSGDFEVTKAELTVTADIQTKVYGATNPTLTFQYSGWVNGEETIDTPPTISTTVDDASVVDTYSDAITLSGGTDNNYTFSLVSGDFEVTKAELTVTADNQTKVYGATNPTLTFQYSGWVNGVETIDTPPSISTTVDETSGVATYANSIILSGGLDNNYTLNLIPGDFEVTKAILTVTADNQTKVYGAVNPTLTFQYSGWVNGVETIDTPPSISTSVNETSPTGTYVDAITVSGAVDDKYNFVYVSGDFNVTKSILTVTAHRQVKEYGAPNPPLTFSYSGWINGIEEIDVPPTIYTNVDFITTAGTYVDAILFFGGSDDHYTFNFVYGTFEVYKATLLVSADKQTRKYGEENPELTYTVSGWKNSDQINDLITKPVVNTTVAVSSGPGIYNDATTVSGAYDVNYVFNYAPADFEVTKATLTVSAESKSKCFDGEVFSGTNSATFSGFVAGEDPTNLGGDLNFNGTFATAITPGTYTIIPEGLTSKNYDIVYQNGSFLINPLPTATISGDAEICAGSTGMIKVGLTGQAPWSLTYTDGTTTETVTDIYENSYSIGVTVPENTSKTYTITSVTDFNGCSNTAQGSATIKSKSATSAGEISGDQLIAPETLPTPIASVKPGSGSGSITYAWESSLDNGLNWEIIPEANEETYAPEIPEQTIWFRRIAISSENNVNCASVTNPVKISLWPTGVNNQESSESSWSAYAVRNTEIRLKADVGSSAIARLYDIQGRLILVKNLEKGSFNIIPTPNIKPGIYMLFVKENEKIQGFKIPVKE